LIGDAFFDTSTAFVRQARRFDPGIAWEDIGQALRNVWIVNSLQMLLDSPVELSPAVFAYSMLYPYTDNLLDDPGVDGAAKIEFNRGLDRRLRGAPEPASSSRQREVWRLIESIEAQYPRPTHPGVFGALLAIQAGQVRSLEQQESTALGTEDLLALSLEKGGASVLVDGYLVRGFASAAEEEFYFGYGVFLQFLDDLQDARSDAAAGHRTLFSAALADGPLDTPTAILDCLLGRVLEDSATFGGPEFSERRDLIHRNCTFLLVSAVAENPELFSRRFRRGLQGSWPLQFRAMRRLRRRAAKRFRAATEVVRRRQGSDLDPLFEDAAQSFSGTST
jgi:hypothetical protein